MEQCFSVPTECDAIMEGGVTSGVVFPSFIARLATRFDLRSIGGTSVGAVAASAAAAAQFWRNDCRSQGRPNQSERGFDRLAGLAQELKQPAANGRSTLFSLFQPVQATRRHFAILSAVLNCKSAMSRLMAGLGWTTVICWHAPLAGLAACVFAWWSGHLTPPALLLVGPPLAILLGVVQCLASGYRALSRNNFGMCSGMGSDPAMPALTQWLHALIQQTAFGGEAHAPLTFGDLRQSSKSITLAFMSTGVTERRAHRFPHGSKDLLFRRSQLQGLFPADVVHHLCEHARKSGFSRPRTVELLHKVDPGFGGPDADLFHLPPEDDLPVVFAARLSLSFPVLLQAIPLFRVRYLECDGVKQGEVDLVPVWLSDGGLCSNFPMHFFDDLLPERPAFGIALESSLAEGAPDRERVQLPATNGQGLVGSHLPANGIDGKPSLLKFLAALLNTSRGWRDEALKLTPGYRDRIVRIRHTASEGGLNLDMDPDAIDAMSRSGVLAADAVIERFLGPDGNGAGWMNHRWVRARSTAAVLHDTLEPLTRRWHSNDQYPTYRAMWEGAIPGLPASYSISAAQRQAGLVLWEALEGSVHESGCTKPNDRVPRPHPTLEITPKLS